MLYHSNMKSIKTIIGNASQEYLTLVSLNDPIGSPPKITSQLLNKRRPGGTETPPGYYLRVIRPRQIHFCNQAEHLSNIYHPFHKHSQRSCNHRDMQGNAGYRTFHMKILTLRTKTRNLISRAWNRGRAGMLGFLLTLLTRSEISF